MLITQSKSEEEKPTFELDCHIFKNSEKKLGPGAEGAPYMLKWCGCKGIGDSLGAANHLDVFFTADDESKLVMMDDGQTLSKI